MNDLLEVHKMMIRRYRALILEQTVLDKVYWTQYCNTALEITNTDKLSRWVGFLQGVLFSNGLITVDAERDYSRNLYKPVYEIMGMDSKTVDVDTNSEGYETWFREKVQEALDSDAPTVPHDTVMTQLREVVDRRTFFVDTGDLDVEAAIALFESSKSNLINITIAARAGAGKTTIAYVVAQVLREHGFDVTFDPLPDNTLDQLTSIITPERVASVAKNSRVNIIEKQHRRNE